MPNTYHVNLRDIRFALLEHLGIDALAKGEAQADLGPEEISMILDEAYRFCRGVVAPLNLASDRVGARYADGQVTTPPGFREAWIQTGQKGWVAPEFSPEFGGMGLPGVLGVVITELFIGACTAFELNRGLTKGVGHMIEAFGTKDQRARFVEKLYSGEWAGTMVLTEPGAGSHLADIRTTATRVAGADHYLIEGTKCFISAGEHDLTPNIVHAVLARLPNGPGGTKDLGLFLVPKYVVDEHGGIGERNDVACVGIEHKMGIHGSPTCVLTFGEAGACKGWLLGTEEFQGMSQMFQMMNEARIMTGLQGVALAGLAYENAKRYAQERLQGAALESAGVRQAPSVPIIRHADVRRMLLLQKSHVEGMRAMTYYTAFLADRAAIEEDEETAAGLQARLSLLTPVVKAFCSDKGFEMCSEAIQTLGGYGYTSDYPVEQCTRDARIASLYEGTNFIQAADLVGRKLLRDRGVAFSGLLDELTAWVDQHRDLPELELICARLAEAIEDLGRSARRLLERGAAGDLGSPMGAATRFLHMTAETLVGWQLGSQAAVALGALRKDLPVAEQTFYRGKVLTARFFAQNVLPGVSADARVIELQDTSLFEMPEGAF
jgi:alkylation response protein AidB-like acyl-CoA dehydrogenase